MAGSLAGSSLRRSPHRRPFSVELEFDPCELIGTLVPFVDPFGYDERDFRAEAFFPVSSQPSVHAATNGAAVTLDMQPPQAELVRTRLTVDQAIFIFCQRSSKTVGTAALLAAKYGISPKAIRDIWTLKSWAAQTKPYWSLTEET